MKSPKRLLAVVTLAGFVLAGGRAMNTAASNSAGQAQKTGNDENTEAKIALALSAGPDDPVECPGQKIPRRIFATHSPLSAIIEEAYPRV
jgi:hypothetical protein